MQASLVKQRYAITKEVLYAYRPRRRPTDDDSLGLGMFCKKLGHTALGRFATALHLNSGQTPSLPQNEINFVIALAPPHNIEPLLLGASKKPRTHRRLHEPYGAEATTTR